MRGGRRIVKRRGGRRSSDEEERRMLMTRKEFAPPPPPMSHLLSPHPLPPALCSRGSKNAANWICSLPPPQIPPLFAPPPPFLLLFLPLFQFLLAYFVPSSLPLIFSAFSLPCTLTSNFVLSFFPLLPSSFLPSISILQTSSPIF